ncbi:MAG: type II toxin-antitoxin system VapB family antitoxin [Pseudomonadota bacterium]|jgi:Arc/MetJ family transcription regulator|nr:type II toxin-antitoxin system VapB family antitoxin [Pseudomonadota bacterium]
MRTNIVIDDDLMAEAQAALGVKTKREAVEEALRRVVQLKRQQGLRALRGIGWEGDLDAMRTD